jgi:hypothetical protein
MHCVSAFSRPAFRLLNFFLPAVYPQETEDSLARNLGPAIWSLKD